VGVAVSLPLCSPLSFSLPSEGHHHSFTHGVELAQGFSWSSLDYDGNWKLLQYTTKRYFAPFIVSGAKNDSVVTAYVTTDTMKPLGGTPPYLWCLLRSPKKDYKSSTDLTALVHATEFELPLG
jgi:hypothetical protein